MRITSVVVTSTAPWVVALLMLGCAGNNGEVDPSQMSPSPGGQQSSVAISAISASPSVLLPGQSTLLSVTASSSSGATLRYYWHAAQGTLGSNSINATNWTAPNSVGTYSVSVDVTDGSGSRRANLSIVVSVAPVSLSISSVMPAEARIGEAVTVLGSGFGSIQGTSTVSIAGVNATVRSWSDTSVEFQVPQNATTGEVLVRVGGVDSTAGQLTVLWAASNPANVVVSNMTNTQNAPVVASDGQGGAIVAWADYRNGNADIYAQRLSSTGVALWTSGGRAVSLAANHQLAPRIVADGAGGAIIVWHDLRDGTNYNIYAQRLDSSAAALWAANGEAVAIMAFSQTEPRVVGDGSSGAVIVWQDFRSNSSYDLYSQRLNGAGSPQWAAGGVPVVTAADNQFNPQLVSDNAGGAIVAWEDYRSGTNFDIYAQRIDSAGAPQWALDGVSVSSSANNQSAPHLAEDGAGGVVVVWQDYRSGSHYDVYAQLLNSAGAGGWALNGVPVCNAVNNQVLPQVVLSESDQYIVVWEDYRDNNADIHAQKINNLGVAQWTSNGLTVTAAVADQKLPRVVADGANGAIVAWQDHRTAGNSAVYAQRIGPSGNGLWVDDGAVISNASRDQLTPEISADGAGGAILVWEDRRSSSVDIYAQGISAGGFQ